MEYCPICLKEMHPATQTLFSLGSQHYHEGCLPNRCEICARLPRVDASNCDRIWKDQDDGKWKARHRVCLPS